MRVRQAAVPPTSRDCEAVNTASVFAKPEHVTTALRWRALCFNSRRRDQENQKQTGDAMETDKTPVSVMTLGLTSVILGLLGAAFYWWTPLGMVISLSGLLAGFIGWTYARRNTVGIRFTIGGMILCAAALTLDFVIAGLGLELVKFHALR